VGGEEPSYPRLWLLSLADAGVTTKMPEPVLAGDPLHQTIGPNWSADGALAFYDSNAAAFVILDPHTGSTTHFPNQTGQPGAWHPNGRDFVAPEINFLGEETSQELSGLQALANSHLILFNWQDGSTQDLTRLEELEDMAPVFSPDGAFLAFARKNLQIKLWTPGRQLWLMRTGTWQAEQLTDEPLYSHFEFAWSPGGDLLAYVRFNQSALTEPPELWVIDPFTARATELVVGGYAPQWLP
jgi:Tol biopolymer transport system component